MNEYGRIAVCKKIDTPNRGSINLRQDPDDGLFYYKIFTGEEFPLQAKASGFKLIETPLVIAGRDMIVLPNGTKVDAETATAQNPEHSICAKVEDGENTFVAIKMGGVVVRTRVSEEYIDVVAQNPDDWYQDFVYDENWEMVLDEEGNPIQVWLNMYTNEQAPEPYYHQTQGGNMYLDYAISADVSPFLRKELPLNSASSVVLPDNPELGQEVIVFIRNGVQTGIDTINTVDTPNFDPRTPLVNWEAKWANFKTGFKTRSYLVSVVTPDRKLNISMFSEGEYLHLKYVAKAELPGEPGEIELATGAGYNLLGSSLVNDEVLKLDNEPRWAIIEHKKPTVKLSRSFADMIAVKRNYEGSDIYSADPANEAVIVLNGRSDIDLTLSLYNEANNVGFTQRMTGRIVLPHSPVTGQKVILRDGGLGYLATGVHRQLESAHTGEGARTYMIGSDLFGYNKESIEVQTDPGIFYKSGQDAFMPELNDKATSLYRFLSIIAGFHTKGSLDDVPRIVGWRNVIFPATMRSVYDVGEIQGNAIDPTRPNDFYANQSKQNTFAGSDTYFNGNRTERASRFVKAHSVELYDPGAFIELTYVPIQDSYYSGARYGEWQITSFAPHFYPIWHKSILVTESQRMVPDTDFYNQSPLHGNGNIM